LLAVLRLNKEILYGHAMVVPVPRVAGLVLDGVLDGVKR